jgi:AcrR family transcriptional regulator
MNVHSFPKKQAAVLVAGKQLFWKFGFKKVTVEEICKTAGISKMTFYKFYPDKLTLAKSIYSAEVQNGMIKFKEVMQSDKSAAEKMEMIMKLKSEATENISKEFLMDFYGDEETGLKQFITATTNNYIEQIIEEFKNAQARGDFRQDFKPEFVMYISQRIVDSINDPYLLELCGNPQEVILQLARLFTFGIAPHQNS